MEQIGYLIAGLVILGFLAIIIWELFVSGVKLVLFAIGLAIVVAIYEYIQANIEIFQNIWGYAKYLLVLLPFVVFAYLWKRTRKRERIEELIEELEGNNDFSPSGQKVN